MSVTKLGIIGCGRILDAHLNGFKALWDHGHRSFELVALCSRREEEIARYLRREGGNPPREPLYGLTGDPMVSPHLYLDDIDPSFTAKGYTDWETMLDDDSLGLDAVLILTPVDRHLPMALAAIERGLHVMVEKPLAITVRAGREMVAAAERARVRLAVAEVVRFREIPRMLHWALAAGAIGEVRLVLQQLLATPWSPDRCHADTPWRHRRSTAGAGVALDLGVHLFHLLEYLAGPIETIAAAAACWEPTRWIADGQGRLVGEVACEVDDGFQALVRFASGAVGQVGATTAAHGEVQNQPLTILGARGAVRYGEISFDRQETAPVDQYFRRRCPEAEQARLFPGHFHSPFGLQLHTWLAAIAEGREAETSGAVGLRDLAAAYAVLESAAREGEPVGVDEVLDGSVNGVQDGIERLTTDGRGAG